MSMSPLLAPLLALAPPQTSLDTIRVADGLSRPVGVYATPDDTTRLFVLEQFTANIRVVDSTGTLVAPFLNVEDATPGGGEQGLLGLAFHPQYSSNGLFYVYYTDKNDDSFVTRYHVSPDPNVADPASKTVILHIQQPFKNHKAGRLAFGPNDGYLYVAVGDGGNANDPLGNAQNKGTLLGKILRIDVDSAFPYAIPPGNPFAGPGDPGLDEIWLYGLRNPWRFSFDRLTGDMYIGDVGEGAHEEIDFVPAGVSGLNLGWRCMEGGTCTGLDGCPCPPGITLPIHEYTHDIGCAVMGGFMYRGCAIPDLRGTYFFADYCSNQISSFQFDGTTKSHFMNRTAELAPGGGLNITSITSFGEDAMGEIYICDHTGGEVFKIVPHVPGQPGISSFGTGSPGCNGGQLAGANCSATLLNPNFRLTCSHAPPSSLGLGLVTDVQNVGGMDPFGLGILLHVDLFFSTLFVSVDFTSDATGNGSALLPIPGIAGFAGITLYGQAIWLWTTCALPPVNLSSSTGVAFTLMP